MLPLDEITQNGEIMYTIENAKTELNKGNYALAKTILEFLWNNSNKNNSYLLSYYGRALRKVNESKTFIAICRDLGSNQSIMSNVYIKSTLCWCIYESYIKGYSVEDTEGFSNFIKKAEFIIENCSQMDANEHYKTPYVFTISKVVKVYSYRASKNYKEVIKWLSLLDPERLSEEVFNFRDETGKDRELASPKEFYYYNMTKALEKTEQYELCIRTCETALKQINKFHYKNDMWLKARMYYCKCMIREDIESAIEEYKALAYKESFWFMYHKLSQICWRYNKIPEALLYASKAYTGRFEHEKMVNLLLDTALLWQAKGNNVNAKVFFQASAYYRKLHGWFFPEELKYAISNLEIGVEDTPNIKEIRRISHEYIATLEGKPKRLDGNIVKVLSHGGAGFIKPRDGTSDIYFDMRDVLGERKPRWGDFVEYETSNGKDGRIRAIRIVVRS